MTKYLQQINEMAAPDFLFMSLHTETLKSPGNVPFIAVCSRVSDGGKRSEEGVFRTFLCISGDLAPAPHPSSRDWLSWPSGLPRRPPGFLFFVSLSQYRWYHTDWGGLRTDGGSPPRLRQGTAGWCWRVERRVFREGAEDPLFNLAQVFQMREKAEWCPLSPCHTETFKKPPQWFLKWGVFSRDKKKERKRMSGQRI